jgi:hypothetical protein
MLSKLSVLYSIASRTVLCVVTSCCRCVANRETTASCCTVATASTRCCNKQEYAPATSTGTRVHGTTHTQKNDVEFAQTEPVILVMAGGRVVLSALSAALVWHVVRSVRRRRAQGKPLVIAILGDTFVDVVAGPLEALPTWGTDTLVDRPIKLMLGGSGANLATHLTGAMQQDLLQTGSASSQCVLHSAIGSDELGQFARQQLQQRQVALSPAPQEAGAGQATCLVLSVSQHIR